jgi:hypothetical protein
MEAVGASISGVTLTALAYGKLEFVRPFLDNVLKVVGVLALVALVIVALWFVNEGTPKTKQIVHQGVSAQKQEAIWNALDQVEEMLSQKQTATVQKVLLERRNRLVWMEGAFA